MILDNFLMFDSPTAPADLAQIIGDYVSTNVVDLHMSGLPVLAADQGARDMGIGDNPALKMLVQVTETFASTGAATLQIALQGAPDNGSGAPGTYDTYWLSPLYALASLVAGARLYDMDLPRPPQGVEMPRFLRMIYTIATETTTAGEVVAGIVIDRDDQVYNGTNNAVQGGYPAGITVPN